MFKNLAAQAKTAGKNLTAQAKTTGKNLAAQAKTASIVPGAGITSVIPATATAEAISVTADKATTGNKLFWVLLIFGELITIHMCVKRAYAKEDKKGKPESGTPLSFMGKEDANYVVWGMTVSFIVCYILLRMRRPAIALMKLNPLMSNPYSLFVMYFSLFLLVLNILSNLSMMITFFVQANPMGVDYIAYFAKFLTTGGLIDVFMKELGYTTGPIYFLNLAGTWIIKKLPIHG